MTLTQGLLLLAAMVLAALAVHGIWVSWRARPRRAGVPAERQEPTLGPSETADGATEQGAEPAEPGPRVSTSRTRIAVEIDPLIDAVAEVALDAPVSGDAAIAALPATRRAGSKPFHIEGLNAETGCWEAAQHGRRYGAFQAGVQLANRAGALNEIEYSEFVLKVQTFADALGATADFADMIEVVARARELDDFAHAHDAQLAVHIRAKSTAWTVGFLVQVAQRHGVLASTLPGQLVLPSDDPDAPPLVLLTFDARAAMADDPDEAALRECTLTLDVPQSPESAEAFSRWQRTAAVLCRDMDGDLVDDDGRVVSLQQFASIYQELRGLYDALSARGLAAGSAAARRLFS